MSDNENNSVQILNEKFLEDDCSEESSEDEYNNITQASTNDILVAPSGMHWDKVSIALAFLACFGAVGGDDDSDDKEKEEEAERERLEAIREAEERRKEKHRKMEEEREKMRQEIRDKYNIKKKEEIVDSVQEEPNPLMRKKKTPEELAREAELEDEDEFTIAKMQN
ncbi:hypothetical protein FQA39_LY08637 [Lamprigera yunnana]|nr:hypothetical protein FQA39_LY08637 [Lamprigera yunnana]